MGTEHGVAAEIRSRQPQELAATGGADQILAGKFLRARQGRLSDLIRAAGNG